MKQFFAFLINFLSTTIVTFLSRPATPTSRVPAVVNNSGDTVISSLQETLATYILSKTMSLGPMPGTGGVVHKVSKATAILIAGLLIKYAKNYGVRLSLLARLIQGESDFDPRAKNPNNQDAKPGETAEQAELHADVGIGQVDISTAFGNAAFAKLSLLQIEEKLYDPEVAVAFVCKILAHNLEDARAEFEKDPSLVRKVPDGNPDILALQGYNSGEEGALEMAHKFGLVGNWKYGIGVVDGAKEMASLLDVAQ